MEDSFKIIVAFLYLILILFLFSIGIFGAYLFYFGDCKMVKSFWLITYTPARCIK